MDEFLRNLGAALMASLTTAFTLLAAAVPRIIGFLVILIIGWLVAGLLAGAVAALLRAINFNELSRRSGLTGFVQRMGMRTDASGLLAGIVKWFVCTVNKVPASQT